MLLGIMSCAGNEQRRQAQRDTWLQELPEGVDYRFFVGQPVPDPDGDVVVLNCDDSWRGLTQKVLRMCAWAYANEVQNMFKLDDDTYLQVLELLAAGIEDYDYVGYIEDQDYARYPFPVYPHAQGGPGYGLSYTSLQLITTIGVPDMRHQEEVAVATTLFTSGIRPKHNPRFVHREGSAVPQEFISLHKCSDMRKVHNTVLQRSGHEYYQTSH